jgi:hypothetical protein
MNLSNPHNKPDPPINPPPTTILWYPKILPKLGATEINCDNTPEPTNEEEFKKLSYISPKPISWNSYLAMKPSVIDSRGVNKLKMQRDVLLSDTDWIMTVDNVNTIQNIDDWTSYRQTLRDAPTIYKNYIWTSTGSLDLKAMGLPDKPPIIRKS